MSQYTPIPTSGGGSQPPSPRTPRSRSMSLRLHSRRQSQLPNPDEMDRAFDDPADDDDEHNAHEGARLLSSPDRPARPIPIPGDYDFEHDYTLPPPGSPPPFEDYSASNPAPGNSNGILPTNVARPAPRVKNFLGGILPAAFRSRQQAQQPHGAVGGGQSGIFTNLSARPDNHPSGPSAGEGGDGPEWANETELKDAPPSYQSALRDAVPPYWDTTVVLPSSSSPFGPLSSSINGDEILIDGMAVGNLFGLVWNLIVSYTFGFVGFVLTYVLHTTHSAKFGSRAGFGGTLIYYGLDMRVKAADLMKTGRYPESFTASNTPGKMIGDVEGEMFLSSFINEQNVWPYSWTPPEYYGGHGEEHVLTSVHHAEQMAHQYNLSLSDIVMQRLPPLEVGRANMLFGIVVLTIGWFVILASVGGWLRVKRFERKLHQAQRESEAAQAAARGFDETHPAEPTEPTPTREAPGPTDPAYYTAAFTQAFNGVRELQRGFFGMRGRQVHRGETLFSGDDAEDELLQAQGFGLEPMAQSGPQSPQQTQQQQRRRGMWNVG